MTQAFNNRLNSRDLSTLRQRVSGEQYAEHRDDADREPHKESAGISHGGAYGSECAGQEATEQDRVGGDRRNVRGRLVPLHIYILSRLASLRHRITR